jgi:DNA-binding NarL/FixJ family response regulator
MIRVAVVDDHTIVRDGLVALLGADPEFRVVGSAGDALAAVQLCVDQRPDVVLMDLSMPGVDGTEAIRRLSAAAPEVRVLVLTSFADRTRVLDALAAGAVGYLLKDADPEDLTRAIHTVVRGDSPLDPRAARTVLSAQRGSDPAGSLSDRERQVLALVAEGLPNKQIGRRLEITEKTVKTHLTSAYRKIGVDDRMQAGLWARRNGLEFEDVSPA